MKLKELYLKNQDRRYSAVESVKKDNVKLEMKPLLTMKKNIVWLLLMLVIVIGLLLLHFDLKYFLVSMMLIGILVLVFIFGNKSSLTCCKDCLNVKQGVQNLNIPYENLRNVYIGRVSGLLFFLPAFNYNIVVRYEDNFSFLRELEFSLLCSDHNEVEKFINNFEVANIVEQRYVAFEKRKFLRRTLGGALTFILAVLLTIYVLSVGGMKIF